tara:strand:+ start:568 stop:1287 length:720 start_codon:yes stop_codon:yes gene_type:complete
MTQSNDTPAAAPAAGTPPVDVAATPTADAQQSPADVAAAPAGGDILDTPPADGAQTTADGDVLADADVSTDEGVPDSYTFEAPEGLAIDQAALDNAMSMAKDAGLSQSQFETMVTYDLERTKEAGEAAVDTWNTRVQGWRDAAKNDTDFGGDNYDANVKDALRLMGKFGDADLTALVKSPSPENPEGLAIGNNPAFLRFLNRIGKVVQGEPNLLQGDAAQTGASDAARLEKMYPSMFSK